MTAPRASPRSGDTVRRRLGAGLGAALLHDPPGHLARFLLGDGTVKHGSALGVALSEREACLGDVRFRFAGSVTHRSGRQRLVEALGLPRQRLL